MCWQYSFSILGHISRLTATTEQKRLTMFENGPRQRDYRCDSMPVVTSRESLSKEWNGNASEKLKVSGKKKKKCWEWPSQRSKGVRIDDKKWRAVMWWAIVWKEKEWEAYVQVYENSKERHDDFIPPSLQVDKMDRQKKGSAGEISLWDNKTKPDPDVWK